MDELPIPSSGSAVPADSAQANQLPTQANPSAAADPKALQANAAEQIEAAILQTTTSPAERAQQIHAIKAAYLKARYNIESKAAGR